MSSNVVLVTCRQMQVELPRHIERLSAAGFEVRAPDLGTQQFFTGSELAQLGGNQLVGIIAGDDDLSRQFMSDSPNLRVIIRWGIGMDSVDHSAAADLGILVKNTPGVFNDEVADSALAYLLALVRGIPRVDASVRRGEWPKFEGETLAGSTVGVIGLGGIGRAICRRLLGFDLAVMGYDPFVTTPPDNVTLAGLDELLETSRYVILACPLTADTFHLLNERTIGLMAPGSFLINVARGPVVDESALVRSLQDGHLSGAALDVYEHEPLASESALRSFPNVVLGAHNGSNTRQGVERASQTAVDLLLESLS